MVFNKCTHPGEPYRTQLILKALSRDTDRPTGNQRARTDVSAVLTTCKMQIRKKHLQTKKENETISLNNWQRFDVQTETVLLLIVFETGYRNQKLVVFENYGTLCRVTKPRPRTYTYYVYQKCRNTLPQGLLFTQLNILKCTKQLRSTKTHGQKLMAVT